ncbi:hypothetical protein BKI52_17960 [marine bacterium AO1-C]|nr:hypothetical protein BKI52_17960 [marine bacterium AO1-C]
MKAELFTDQDYERLLPWVESRQVLLQWASPGYDYPVTKTQLIKKNQERGDQRLIYKGVLDDEIVAHGEIGFIDDVNQSARLCKILINPARRGQGLGTLWIKTLVDIGFVELKLNRIELNVYDYNQPAITCYQKAGLTIEGRIRDAYKVDNNFWSVYRMSILRTEWLAQNTGVQITDDLKNRA